MTKFQEDLDYLVALLNKNSNLETIKRLNNLKKKLVRLYNRNLVKINHSVMELVCAKYLSLSGYEVDVECLLNGLSCDIYAKKGLGMIIVEVETGYVPPEHALYPITYCKARIASKITRYSGYAGKFVLASPLHYIMQIHPALTKPPRYREDEEIKEIKTLCDLYYRNPQVSLEEIRNARLHSIYTLNIDECVVDETDPETYIERHLE